MNAANTSRLTWHLRPSARLNRTQRYWMARPGALTAGLRALGAFSLRVSREYSDGAQAAEARVLRIAPGTPVWIREVVMSVDGVDCVSARSITPLNASKGIWAGIRKLKTRPLADMLYGDADISRSLFDWRQLGWGDPLWTAVLNFSGPKGGNPHMHLHSRYTGNPLLRLASRPRLYARRSVFWRRGQPLLVAECFLPAFWDIARPPGARSTLILSV